MGRSAKPSSQIDLGTTNGEHAPANAREPGCDDTVEFDPEALEREAAETPPDEVPPAAARQTLIGGIDLDSISLAEDYAEGMADEGDLTALRIIKPQNGWFIRTHPTHWKNVRLLEIKGGADRGFYIVARPLWGTCQSPDSGILLKPVRLTLATSREEGPFLWPLKLQEEGCKNRTDEWSASALRICKTAETAWVKMYTRPGGSCYSQKIAEGITAEPAWPSQSFEELLALAFDGKVLQDPDDPLLRRIQGKE
jgi:hypothetical protein